MVILTSGNASPAGVTLAEVLHTSDVPQGVINLLTGSETELASHFATHKDVNGIIYAGNDGKVAKEIESKAADNMKRVEIQSGRDWQSEEQQSPYSILQHSEIKTTWHPIGS